MRPDGSLQHLTTVSYKASIYGRSKTRLDQLAFGYQYLNENPELFGQLVG